MTTRTKLDPLAEIERVARELRDDSRDMPQDYGIGYSALRCESSGMLRAAKILRPYVDAVEELRAAATKMRDEMDVLDQADELYPRPRAALWDAGTSLHTALARFEEPSPDFPTFEGPCGPEGMQ